MDRFDMLCHIHLLDYIQYIPFCYWHLDLTHSHYHLAWISYNDTNFPFFQSDDEVIRKIHRLPQLYNYSLNLELSVFFSILGALNLFPELNLYVIPTFAVMYVLVYDRRLYPDDSVLILLIRCNISSKPIESDKCSPNCFCNVGSMFRIGNTVIFPIFILEL